MQHHEWSEDQLLPFDVIMTAKQGGSEVLAKVMKHFENDIVKNPFAFSRMSLASRISVLTTSLNSGSSVS